MSRLTVLFGNSIPDAVGFIVGDAWLAVRGIYDTFRQIKGRTSQGKKARTKDCCVWRYSERHDPRACGQANASAEEGAAPRRKD